MARQPEHDVIQIVATKEQADQIAQMFLPYFDLALVPGVQTEDDLPTYFFALTDTGAKRAFG